MGERDDARHQVDQKRERVSRIAHEVSRRMTPDYAKERARDMARQRAMRMRESAVESSWFGPLLGAGIGALVAKAVQSRAQQRRYGYRGYVERYGDDRYGYERYARPGYAAEHDRRYWTEADDEELYARAGDASEPASEMKDRASGTASELKDRVTAKASDMKDRLQEKASTFRERMPDRHRIRASTRDDTAIWAFGAMALGALFGLALPVSQSEREMLEPARRKARELGQQAKDVALEKGRAAADKAIAATEGRPEEQEHVSRPGEAPSMPGSPTPIH